MLKLNLHARIEIALIATLLLGSCDSLPHGFTGADYSRLEAADVNGRNAIYRVDALENRVSDLESRLHM